VRKLIALGVVAGLLISLSACTTSAPSGACTPTAAAGEASKLVSVSGPFAGSVTASFPTPLNAADLQVSVLTEGDGPTIYDGDIVDFKVTGYDGTSGALGLPTEDNSQKVLSDTPIQDFLRCVTVGSRLSVVVPPAKGAGEGSSLIFVIDVVNSYYGKAVGAINAPQAGFPSVVTAPHGEPGITILATPAPTDLSYTTLVTGTGPEIAAGDTVKLQYTAVDWTSKTVAGSSWSEGQGLPVARTLTSYDASTGMGIGAGALKALIGKTVGSQVMVIMPPKSYAGGLDFSASSGSTLVIVYDILDLEK
jgi:FKBP-type peptidyl-prolyl cis-trans isomerase